MFDSVRRFALLGALLGLAVPAAAQVSTYRITNLISDQAGHALVQDPDLVNGWGISMGPATPFWVSDNGTGKTTLYDVHNDPAGKLSVSKVGLVVTIPGDGSITGQVFNGGTGFNTNRFLFVSEDGTVSGWRGALGTTAETLRAGSQDNVYKGVALNGNSLYAANFRTGAIDVLNGDLTSGGSFSDPNAPAGYAPFNIQNVGGKLYVTFAQQDAGRADEVAGAGHGFVDVFDPTTNTFSRLVTGSAAGGAVDALDAPWGVALAPSTFGIFGNDLLVGNFGDGRINAFDPLTGAFLGALQNSSGNALAIDGLWGLTFGNNGRGGLADTLYFAAGPNGETHGLFGSVQVTPEPGPLALVGAMLVPALLLARRRR